VPLLALTCRPLAEWSFLGVTGAQGNDLAEKSQVRELRPGRDLLDHVFVSGRPRQDSNLRTRLRRPMLYPLSYGGSGREKDYQHPAPP
jgi:hypothetical protein